MITNDARTAGTRVARGGDAAIVAGSGSRQRAGARSAAKAASSQS